MRLKIDGIEVEVPAGVTVKEAALAAGIKIPGLCDHPELKPYGGCRLCLVEIESVRGYPSSCTLPAAEGMIVKTDTPTLKDLRLGILEMLLSEHPCICLMCERAGRCDEIREGMRKVPQTMGCRYCPKDKRCELQETVEMIGLKKVELPHIGPEKEIVRSPFFDRDPNLCILCGRCIRACEDRGLGVISFISRGFDTGIGTAFEKPPEESGCRFCGACVDVCPTGSLVERGNKWAGPAEKVVTTTCPYCSANCQIGLEVGKGRFLRARPEGSRLCVRGRFGLEFIELDRLKRPMIKKNGRLMETSWSVALDFVAEKLAKFLGKDFAFITSGSMTNEDLYLSRKFAKIAMKSRAVAPDVASEFSLENALKGQIIVVGDIAVTNPAIELLLRSSKPVVISPLRTMLAKESSIWLRPMPGYEPMVLAALANAVNGERIENIGGSVSAEEIVKTAESLSRASIVIGPDCSEDIVGAARRLESAAKGKLCILGRNCNSHGVSVLGLNHGYEETMTALSDGRLKAAYILGSNPAREEPDLKGPLSKLDFLVVQDLFLTETAKLADVVLPAASFAEVDATFTGSDGRCLAVRQALPLRGGRPDWQILAEISRRMGLCGFEFSSSDQVLAEMKSHVDLAPNASDTPRSDPIEPTIEEQPPVAHSVLLIKGPSIFEFGSGTRTSKVSDLRYLTRDRYVEIHPTDAGKLHISKGDVICIQAGNETIRATAKISPRLPGGVVRVSGKEGKASGAKVIRDV